MRKTDIGQLPLYFERYIQLVREDEMNTALQNSLNEIDSLPLDKWMALGDRVYAPGKWSIKDIVQHLIDTERIFTYRALCMARGDFERKPEFDENEFALQSKAGNRQLSDLIEELKTIRKSSIALFNSFGTEVLLNKRCSFENGYSVLAIAFIIAGHQIHHLNVLTERYYPLLD